MQHIGKLDARQSMLTSLTLLSLLHKISYGNAIFHTCIPRSQFHFNGRSCVCDAMGRWSEANCEAVSRRQTCKPGQIIWEDCSQCICQENGHMLCTNILCGDETSSKPSQIGQTIDMKRLWCIPFMSYYVNCSLCVCPVSGKMNDARCARDATCPFRGTTDYLTAVKNNVCIPKVMYLFPCLHCLCSDDGFFVVSKCVETCQKAIRDIARRCTPKTFYRKDCNVCFCPDKSITNDFLCTKAICSHRVTFDSLVSLRNKTRRCQRQTFTGPKCFYCECNQDGIVNESSCFESECMSIDNFEYNFKKSTCSFGEIVPKCVDCFCLRDGTTNPEYCSKECTEEQKLDVLEDVIKASLNNHYFLDRKAIKQLEYNEECEPNSIYKKQGRYCLCSNKGYANSNLCTTVIEEHHEEKNKNSIRGNAAVNIDLNTKCDPNTFVDFDCNSCYCLKTGRINPKWCTFDDCESKRAIMERQKNERDEAISNNGTCTPGSISKEECNFCICPENGQIKDRACTKNRCANVANKVSNVLTCEPLNYYSVDCNICYCPKNGIKNVAKCTKNTCEKTFLRSDVCVPGRLFSDECNVCVCPPNGDKADRVCTNNTCTDSDTPWKKIFQLSQSLMSYQKGDTTRNLELCFPGEEFEMGCKVCLCPDMGLRVYATCTQMLCDDEKNTKEGQEVSEIASYNSDGEKPSRTRRFQLRDCVDLEDLKVSPLQNCTPGSMYIIKCEQCICPYMGNIAHFCRPMPKNMYCEQAYPGFNYLPYKSNRRKGNATTMEAGLSTDSSEAGLSTDSSTTESLPPPHPHTAWSCSSPGHVMDDCFICECQTGVIIQEHCFKSHEKSCVNRTMPKFLEIKVPDG